MQPQGTKTRHREGRGRPSPADLGAKFPPSKHARTVPFSDIHSRLVVEYIIGGAR